MSDTHNTAPTRHAEANGISFAYRRFGAGPGVPVVFLQHFMGNLDDHDPAITDALAAGREVILFNNAGVASSTGTTADTVEQTARDAESFIDALGLEQVDLLAHSMGGLVAQQIATDRPELIRKLILVGTGPRGGEGIGEMAPQTAALFTVVLEHQEQMWLPILFSPSKASQIAGRDFLERIMARPDRDAPVTAATVQAQGAAIHSYGTRKDPSYAHLADLRQPTLVVNGNNDIIIATINSYILQQHLPDATLVLYPDANHGAHFQYPGRFVEQVRMFLDD
ncbi:alpha/beta fold hydrolase [Actinoplanes sp. L3-i22]|uniref:alpha/beta fold hydrolase n=1 Tax=Actinoplanes sp. L3-i22 TaxID=2836373 RepID=UPI001C76F669|nr:alpha/beta hydrolase [Actinoplanes sp. L3-i22]BCY09146.1 alpha/beta hydrolase [Actinoplanes sp. L3-i22]